MSKELTKIKKIHFLIHPGFQSDTFLSQDEYSTKQNNLLFNKYSEHIRKLPPDEIIVAFTHTNSPELANDFKRQKQYTEELRGLKEVVGRRLIVLSDSWDPLNFSGGSKESIAAIKEIAQSRGFVFDETVLSEAFGELAGMCVEIAANNLNEAGKFASPTVIKTELTDNPSLPNDLKGELTKRFPHISYLDQGKK